MYADIDVADRAVTGHVDAIRSVFRGGELGCPALAVDVDEPVSGRTDHTVLGGDSRGDLTVGLVEDGERELIAFELRAYALAER